MSWFVYILQCQDASLYTGITTDIPKRLKLHNAGKGAKYTAQRLPVSVVWSEACENESAARKREFEIKQWPRQKKLHFIQSNTGQ